MTHQYGGMSAGELRELLAQATPQNIDTAQEIESGTYECPLCQEGEVEGSTFTNYDGAAMGVQFFGIGDEHVHAERLFRATVRALPDLLAAVERAERLEAALRKIMEPITVAADAETVIACQDLHELICDIADRALARPSEQRGESADHPPASSTRREQ